MISYIPADASQPNEFAAPVTIPRTYAFVLGVFNALSSGPVSAILNRLEVEKLKDLDNSPFLNYNDWKNSEYFRPELNHQFKNGVMQSVAQYEAQRVDSENQSEALANDVPSGALSAFTRYGSEFIGAALDPINAATAYLAPELLGPASRAIRGALEGSGFLGRLGANAAVGSLLGATIGLPQSLTDYSRDIALGNNHAVLDLLTNVGQNAAFGGILEGAGGILSKSLGLAKRIVSRRTDPQLIHTAIEQLASDKSVNIDDMVKHGYNEQRTNDIQIDDDQLQFVKSKIQQKIDEITKTTALTEDQLVSLNVSNMPENLQGIEDIFTKKQAFDALIKTRQDLDSIRLMQDYNFDDITGERIRNLNEYMRSHKSNLTYDQNDVNELQQMLDDVKVAQDGEEQELQNTINQYRESGDLTEDDENMINDIDDYDSQQDQRETAIRQLAACLRENE